MTLVADWGGAESNSYIGLTAANSFIGTAIFNHVEWDAASAQRREAALMEATRDIDSYTYVGGRYYSTQMLAFPRESQSEFPWDRTSSGSTTFSVEHHRMQVAVEQATCFQALWIMQNNGRDKHADAVSRGIKSWSESAASTSESYTYGGGKLDRLCHQSMTLVGPWRTSKQIIRG